MRAKIRSTFSPTVRVLKTGGVIRLEGHFPGVLVSLNPRGFLKKHRGYPGTGTLEHL